MASSPSQCVVDTNILIDLHTGGLLEEFFSLPFHFLTADVLIAELRGINAIALEAYGLQGVELPGNRVLEVESLVQHHRVLSIADLFAFVLARMLSVTLLTGDRRLRTLATRAGLTVHGTLWVLDELVRLETIPSARAARSLRRMLSCGTRLPKGECQRRFERWGGI